MPSSLDLLLQRYTTSEGTSEGEQSAALLNTLHDDDEDDVNEFGGGCSGDDNDDSHGGGAAVIQSSMADCIPARRALSRGQSDSLLRRLLNAEVTCQSSLATELNVTTAHMTSLSSRIATS